MKPRLSPNLRALTAGSLITLACFLVTAAVTLNLPRTYQGTARLRDDLIPAHDPFTYQTVLAQLVSDGILGGVADRLNLASRWSAESLPGNGALQRKDLVTILRDRITAQNLRGTSLIEIRAYDRDANLAADLANSVVEVYAQHRLAGTPTGAAPIIAIDRAEPAQRAVRPNTPLNLSLGTASGLMLGLLAAIAIRLWSLIRSRRTASPQAA